MTTENNSKAAKFEALKRSFELLQLDDIEESQIDQITNILDLKEIRVKGSAMFEPD